MTPHEQPAFADLLADAMAYYGRDASPFLLDVYWQGLSRFAFREVQRAIALHARDPDRGQFAPRVADLTRLIEGSTLSQGMTAWAKVEAALKHIGRYRSVVFDDPLVHVVITEMGGWTALCGCQLDELPFRARDFERRYAAYRLRRELPAFPSHLVGEHEAGNALNGHATTHSPALIGDPERAARVMERGRQQAALRVTDAGRVATEAMQGLVEPRRGDRERKA